jgi:hypothetical protein
MLFWFIAGLILGAFAAVAAIALVNANREGRQ